MVSPRASKQYPRDSVNNITIDISIAFLQDKEPTTSTEDIIVKQKRWPDWGLNPGPSRHIPDALTTELSGLYQQIN